MIILKDITHLWGDKTLFVNINWTIPPGSRVALVGDNGTGKTTLLKAIVGDQKLDQGEIIIPERSNKTIGYLPQELVELGEEPLRDFLKKASGILALEEAIKAGEEKMAGRKSKECVRAEDLAAYDRALALYKSRDGYGFIARAKQILAGLGFEQDDFDKSCREFSGGWKMRIYLALLLLSRPDILLLDEPTNHLDTPSMEWLENYLADFRGTLIAVAHDRFFLDKMVSQIAELAQGRLTLYAGNYSRYLEEKRQRAKREKKELLLQKGEIARHEAFIARFRYKATKARQVQSRLKLLQKLPQGKEERQEKKVAIKFAPPPPSGREVMKVENLGKKYGERIIFQQADFTIFRGEKVALVGANGAGKSTLTRLLAKTEDPSWGRVEWGINVHLSFFSQQSAENLNYAGTVWEEILATASGMNDQQKRNLLGAFLFSGDDIFKPVAVLSGGEKSRLALLKILLGNTNVLILDEPTNHLDITTKDIFQQALAAYQGTVIVVSHDRYFLDRLVGRVLEITGGLIHDYPGNYSYFAEKRNERPTGQAMAGGIGQAPARAALTEVKKTVSEKRRQAEERNRLYQQRSNLKKALAGLEAKIFVLEEKKAEHESLLCDPQTLKNAAYVKQLHRQLAAINEELAGMYAKWDELSEKMAELSSSSIRSQT